ncbi:NADH-quinone oxidoreductase subunit N [bacterium]|nr:NADH-quinone oxidoreductase subunit N [bacterium]
MSNLNSLQYLYPEIALSVGILVLVLSAIMTKSKIARSIIAVVVLLLTGWILSLNPATGSALFSGTKGNHLPMLLDDGFAHFFKWLFLLAGVVTIWISVYSDDTRKSLSAEYFIILLATILGMFFLVGSTNLLMIYLALEMVSIGQYLLAGFNRKEKRSNEAALKYVIFGGTASGIMLFGMSILFGFTGSVDLLTIVENITESTFVFVAALMVFVGFAFKISAAPLHFWAPDVYEGAPTPITAYFSVAPKAAGFAVILRVFLAGNENWLADWNWTLILAVVSAATMTIGNFVAVQQENIKRMLAYSSISHAGFLLMGIIPFSEMGLQAVVFYLVIYTIMNLGAFTMAILIHRNYGTENISDYGGIGKLNPLFATIFAIFLFSLTGLPPFAGFIGKFYLFAALLKTDGFIWLAAIAIINSVVSLFYYIRPVKLMFFAEPTAEQKFPSTWHQIVLIVILVIPISLFGIYWQPLVNWVQTANFLM